MNKRKEDYIKSPWRHMLSTGSASVEERLTHLSHSLVNDTEFKEEIRKEFSEYVESDGFRKFALDSTLRN